jgi:hypothetical protein
MPNPLRKIANGRPMYSSWLNTWTDDVSGNSSKAWNAHNNMAFTHANLPRDVLGYEFHVHFLSTSQHASAIEQSVALAEMIKYVRAARYGGVRINAADDRSTHDDPIPVKDPETKRDACVRVFDVNRLGDNVAQSECCSHIGANGLHDCRKCERDGSEDVIRTPEGYNALFEVWPPAVYSVSG